ncbi:hypothetical protein CAPI_02345 [Corynebacterium capitovis DSM 44611]|uniref:DUF6912 family protein n=1 Tax=Corynebacterium capitovis TaxID=131081 RepID=UPI00037C042A|nr:hypothetical protein [Corynebacterium capitovis]WKD57043.1 hypothetical protein CAPI_02345 [Corynebacterium capitovis DSM 44611]
MRVYVPATFSMLVSLGDSGVLHARNGWAFAVTPELEAFFTDGDTEELEAIAFDEASRTSIRLLTAGGEEDFPYRRAVVSADVEEAVGHPDMGEAVVKLAGPIALDDVAAIHVDVAEAEDATRRAIDNIDAAELGDEDAELAVGDAQDNYMAFYDPSELALVLEML